MSKNTTRSKFTPAAVSIFNGTHKRTLLKVKKLGLGMNKNGTEIWFHTTNKIDNFLLEKQ